MNQRADSRKKNLELIVAKPLINRQRWLLSHTMRRKMGSQGTFSRATFTRCENNDVHTSASRLTPGGENESAR